MPTIRDPYQRDVIRSYLALPVQSIGGGFAKVLLGMGDRFAVACSMIVDDEGMTNPKTIERICAALDFAFRQRAHRDCALDAYPIYAVFLLEKLHSRASDAANQRATAECLSRLRQFLHGDQ